MFEARTIPEAVRQFEMQARNPDSMISQWPDDYVLYQVGEFDHETAELEAVENLINLGAASQFFQDAQVAGAINA